MKRFVSAVASLVALGWSGIAFAQAATGITTACPVSFQCAFSAAETMAFGTKSPSLAGQPDVFVGYIGFDAGGNVTVTGTQNLNGTVGPISLSGTCAAGSGGQPATITLNDKSQIAFTTDSKDTELQFILSKDQNATGTTTIISNSVRVGVCRGL